MRLLSIILIINLFFSCKEKNKTTIYKKVKKEQIIKSEFQSIIDSSNTKGSILIYDFQKNTYYSNDFVWAKKGHLPASTFKIPNSIIALETGIVKNDNTLFKWNGEKRAYKQWEQDLILRDAFHLSCVPCYQEIAKKIGNERMNKYLTKLKYYDMKVDASNIDMFWLEGDSKINQFQQIDFLKRFYQSKLPISEKTEMIMKRMMLISENEKAKISGKTGLSNTNGKRNGWFVGYVELEKNTFFFATNIEPKENLNVNSFPKTRKEVTLKALKIIE